MSALHLDARTKLRLLLLVGLILLYVADHYGWIPHPKTITLEHNQSQIASLKELYKEGAETITKDFSTLKEKFQQTLIEHNVTLPPSAKRQNPEPISLPSQTAKIPDQTTRETLQQIQETLRQIQETLPKLQKQVDRLEKTL